MKTSLYHAQVGPFCGLAAPVDDGFFFTMMDDPKVYRVPFASMTLRDAIPEAQAEYLMQTYLAPRLHAQGGEA